MAVTRIYDVKGMTCNHCKQAVTEAVKAIDDVRDVIVDLETGKVSVTFRDTVQDDKVRAAVADAGYEVV